MNDLDLTTVPAEEVRKGDELDIAGMEAMVGAVEASTYSQKVTIYDLRHASWVTLPLGTQVTVRRPKPDPDADLLAKLAEVLHELPESSPVKTADNPAPVALPTVDEVARCIHASDRDGYEWDQVRREQEAYRDNARAVLDLIADHVPPWVPVEPGTTIKAGTHYRIEWDDASSTGGASATERHSSVDFTPCPTDPGRYSIDPRTVPAPAEPEDPGVQLLLDWYALKVTPTDADAALLLAKLDAARADR